MPTSNEQGTGKHGHKDSAEPYPHTKGSDGHTQQASSGHKADSSAGHEKQAQGGGKSEDASLKSREYKDASGEIHHHTKSYMDEHGKGK